MDRAKPTSVPAVALSRLPVQLRMLVRVMGEAGAYKLVQWRGGTPYTVPRSLRSPHAARLLEEVGSEATAALVAELSGTTLQLPKYDGVLRQLRHQRVVDLRSKALKHHEIALATGYTVRQVINILNRSLPEGYDGLMPVSPGQADLFGFEDEPAAAAVAETGPTAHNPFGRAQSGMPSPSAEAPEAV